jgi:hypothetical protein
MMKEALLPLTGVLFVVLLIASFVIAGEPPDADSEVQEIVDHYVDNDTAIWISSFVFVAAALALLTFASYLRKLFSDAGPDGSMLPGLILVGASIVAVGGAIDSTIQIALVEAVEDVDPSAVQALQALWDNDFIPIALGIVTFILFSGLATLRTGALPKWLGWLALALVVVAFTPVGFAAFPGTGVWVIITSVLLAVRGNRATA